MSRRIAFLIDGGFFLKRLPHLVRPEHCVNAERITVTMRHLCRNHVKMLTGLTGAKWIEPVYPIFYYDAVPYGGKAHHPIDNRPIDFDKSNIATERRALFDSLRRQRKVALRLGKVNKEHDWTIDPALTKKLLRHRHALRALQRLPVLPDLPGPVEATLALRILFKTHTPSENTPNLTCGSRGHEAAAIGH